MNEDIPPAKSSPPKRRRQMSTVRHEDKLENILMVAARLFSDRGYDATSLDDIADAVRVHKATLYHYIGSKEDILYQCLVRSIANYGDVLKRMEDKTQPPLKRLHDFFMILIEAQNNDFGRCLAIVGRQPIGTVTRDSIRDFQRTLDSAVRNVVKEGIADGSIRNVSPKLASCMLFGAYNWVPRWFNPKGGMTTEQISRNFLDFFFNGISTFPRTW